MTTKIFLQRPIVPVIVMASAAIVIGLAAVKGATAGYEHPSGDLLNVESGRINVKALSADSLNAGASTAPVGGLEYVSSASVKDWASVADVVVVAEATAEEALPPGDSETVTEGDLIGRRVTVRPISTIWIAPTNSRELPGTVDLSVMGWILRADGSRKVVSGGGSRIEVGHTYVLALKWMRAVCGEDPEPAHWAVIGSGAALPLDGEVLGIGEIVGQIVDNLNDLDLIPNTVLEDLVGQPVSALGDALEAVQNTVQRIPFYEVEPPAC